MGNSIRFLFVLALLIIFGVFGTVFLIKQITHTNTALLGKPTVVHAADFIDVANSTVSWTEQGRLLGDDQRRAVRITVSATDRQVELLGGYNQTLEKSITQPNNKTAYTTFLTALENLHFGQNRIVKQGDERGNCPLGFRYIYEIHKGSDQKLHIWSDSCNAANGTFAGDALTTRQLFKAQITDYNQFVAGVEF